MRTSILRGGLACSCAIEPRELAIDLALLQLELADRVVGRRGSPPRPRRTRRAIRRAAAPRPFRPGRTARLLAKRWANALARGLGARSCPRAPARSSRQRLERFSSSGAIGGRSARGGRASIAPMVTARAALAFDAQRGGIEAGREVARDQRGVAGGQIDRDEPRHGRAVRIDRDGIDRGTHVDFGGEHGAAPARISTQATGR